MLIRLQKYLADCGIASRRKSEELIIEGRITVNGVVIKELGTKVDDEKDEVFYRGKKVEKQKEDLIYIMLHKPEGYVTTVKDQFDRPTVIDLIKDIRVRVFPIGRLDYDTSGLLILTNDGELTFKLTHPKHNISKTYIAKLFGAPSPEEILKFKRGLTIDGVKTAPAEMEIIKNEGKIASAKIVIHEGKNRQVRRMCEEIKHPVASLKRVATGNLFLGELEKGKYRHLTEKEVNYLKSL